METQFFNILSRKLLPALAIIIGVSTTNLVKAQKFSIPANSNFYSYLNLFYNPTNYDLADTMEGGENAEIKRYSQIWGPRLYPTGNFSVARNAVINYAKNYSPSQSQYNPNWICLGPSNTASGSYSAKGVGQIHRITFAPEYNGTTNKTIYSASGFGGLWRSENDGSNWSMVNTDLQLPISAVADVAVNYSNPDMIFIAAGTGDGSILHTYYPNWGNINPIFTIGIYRSIDYGSTWLPINTGFIDDFQNFGGTVRRLISNPYNPKILLAATSLGIYRSTNADETSPSSPSWSNVWQGYNLENHDFRSIEWKPGSATIAYAGGTDNIYKTLDAGNTWQSIIGPGTGLDFAQLTGFTPQVINLAVTQANPEKIYTYIYGITTPSVNGYTTKLYIYEMIDNYWVQIYSTTDYLSGAWLALSASPIYADEFFFAGPWYVYGRKHNSTTIAPISPYLGGGFHGDVHVLTYQLNVANPKLFCGNHGGISVKDLSVNGLDGWEYRNNGLQNQLIWDFDDSEYSRGRYTIANQDCGVYIHDDVQSFWKIISGGDGINTKIMKTNPDLLFFNRLYGYNFIDDTYFYDYSYRPNDPRYGTRDPWDGHKNAMFRLPFDDHSYFTSCELYKRLRDYAIPDDYYHPENLWQFNSDMGKTESEQWKRQITKVAFCETDPNFMYIVTGGVFKNDPLNALQIPSLLFKTTTGGNAGDYSIDKFHPVTYPGLGNNVFPVISGIAVHPEDPNKVWLSFIGYGLPIQVAYSSDGGTTWTDADPNKSLPNLPVNSIVYQKGTDDILYIGTDVGVYVKVGNGNWEKYGDFPNVRVTEIKINYCTNKLRVSTFGRSLWEGDLLSGQLTTLTIQSGKNITWNNSMYLTGNLKIEANAQLTIKGTVNVPPTGKIMVAPNAKLIIDGGKVTNGCGYLWQGIEVWGNTTQNQYTSNGVCAQGTVELKNGAIIENAYNGITNWKPNDWNSIGGIIIANGATFRNNRRGVEFMKYKNFDPANGKEIDNLSSFSSCSFEINDQYPAGAAPYFAQASLWYVKGIKFYSCDFLNNRTNNFTGYGIYSLDAGYKVSLPVSIPGTPIDRSAFRNFEYGIYASNSETSNTVFVNYGDFTNNGKGISLLSVNSAVVLNSLFDIGISAGCPNQGTGISMNACTGYSIEKNTFTGGTGVQGATYTGIDITNSGTAYNEIYQNTFHNLTYGNLANQVNGTSNNLQPTGLTYLCNMNSGNINDFYVTNNSRISYFQRSGSSVSAGNSFSNNASYNFYNGGSTKISYYYSPGQAPFVYYNLLLVPTANSNGCPVHYGDGMGDLVNISTSQTIEKEQQYANAFSAYNNVKAVYESLKDGGNTANMVDDIATSIPSEMWELRNKLLGDSPHLSQTSLKEASLKNDVLPESVLFDVLAANPDELRNQEFLDFLKTKDNPMPDYMVELLSQIAGNTSGKTIIQEQLFTYDMLKSSAADDILRSKLNDTTFDQMSILNWLDNKGDLASQYQMIDTWLQTGSITAAQVILSTIPEIFQLSESETADYQNFSTVKNIQFNLKNSGRNLFMLDSTEISSLTAIANSGKGIASAQAKGILGFTAGNQYCQCNQDDLLKHSAVIPKVKTPESGNIELAVSPNPATTWIAFDYTLPDSYSSVTLTIYDNTGRVIEKVKLTGKQGQKVLNTSSYPSGAYAYKCKQLKNGSGKFIIQ